MRFDRESYRKLYVAESADHQLMALVSRGLRDYLLRFAAEDGTILPSTTDPVADLMVVLRARPADKKTVAAALEDLQRVGYLKLERKRLWIPRFEDAQAARTPGAKRQAAYKSRQQSKASDDSGDVTEASPISVTSDVIKASPGDVTANVTLDETRRDETTAPKPPAVVAVACPGDLKLTESQRGTLETGLIPGWAIDAITLRFVAKHGADPDDKRPLVAWRKCLSQAISGDWNDANKRPKKPDGNANVILWDTEAGRVAQ